MRNTTHRFAPPACRSGFGSARRTVARRLRAWLDQRTRYQLIQQALQRRKQMRSRSLLSTTSLRTRRARAPPQLWRVHHGRRKHGTRSRRQTQPPYLAALLSRTAQRELLSIYDDRIQTQQQLASVYGKWSAQVPSAASHRTPPATAVVCADCVYSPLRDLLRCARAASSYGAPGSTGAACIAGAFSSRSVYSS